MEDNFLCTVTTFKDNIRSEHIHLVRSTRKIGAIEVASKNYQRRVDNGVIDSFVVHVHETLI